MDGDKASKRRKLNEDAITKRRERRLWESNRDKLLFEYSQFTYYSKPVRIYIYNMLIILVIVLPKIIICCC